MKNGPFRFGFLIVGVIVAVVFWLYLQPDAPVEEQAVAPPTVVKPPEKPVVQHPVASAPEDIQVAAPVIAPEQALPKLKESDTPMAEILARLFADKKLDRFFILDHFIERFVVMVDSTKPETFREGTRSIDHRPGQLSSLYTAGEDARGS